MGLFLFCFASKPISLRPRVVLVLLVLRRWKAGCVNQVEACFFPPQPFIQNNNNNNNQFPSPITEVDLWIRKSRASDLKPVADFLANALIQPPAAVSANNQFGLNTNWKAYIDRLWARNDIEALLKGRYDAMEEGYRALKRIRANTAFTRTTSMSNPTSPGRNNNKKYDSSTTDKDILNLVWYNSDRLRTLIAQVSQETGEDNVWKQHNFALPPQNTDWFHHIQITALDRGSSSVVGFCEIAMLAIPVRADGSNNPCEGWDTVAAATTTTTATANTGIVRTGERAFAPAIANLATHPDWRRRGIATRLLKAAERYVLQHWNVESLGLYVQQVNTQALALYTSAGYSIVGSCPGDDRTGPLWYMRLIPTTQATSVLPSPALKETRGKPTLPHEETFETDAYNELSPSTLHQSSTTSHTINAL